MPENIRTADHTWLILNQMSNFSAFLQRLPGDPQIQFSTGLRDGAGGKERYRYYTCRQEHDRRNPAWKPFQHLSRYCERERLDFYEAKDMIEERIGRKLGCECELPRN